MTIQAHLDSLYARHQQLKGEIEDCYSHHISDLSLKELKKQKLKLKEAIFYYENLLSDKASSDSSSSNRLAA